ncbi:tRNA (mnm(5)s(2)U34)-methyltransferase [Staphylococcus hyicus]|uniref:tRNA (mnm(5)s(2)U34)-methyltransferase n=1 Tax=Staphylococcus hyicus TaxID=1284 RepID=UPI00208E6536|nr:class I SAM-dependent methyltransferase [Staphylococcus hyicus]MCO4328132.1 methyltransferase domain-containing protein [Staphylococcus hyicus]MCO4330543.1 methyltransferase domain-containing protein [Staphylococcus hyicus]MCO4333813.1 methyltransferase domain-containing protein [Staphylococcus hyicus]MCO4336411.1 methyltransferase domain-containing protein [Staphylococcus hyicus]
MIVQRILPFAKSLIKSHVRDDSIVIDGTCGNGHDTEFLAQTVPNGHVYACDIQLQAIEQTRQKVQSYSNVTVIHTGHENITQYIDIRHRSTIDAALFNLGYLPKGDKAIVTTAPNTIKAFESIFKCLRPEGIIVLAIYPGHPEGYEESQLLNAYFEKLDQQQAHVIKYEFINQQNHPPYIIGIEKRK